jgi:hypothetical protein
MFFSIRNIHYAPYGTDTYNLLYNITFSSLSDLIVTLHHNKAGPDSSELIAYSHRLCNEAS